MKGDIRMLDLKYLKECFEMNGHGRVIWLRRPMSHFKHKQRRPVNREVGKRAADAKGIVKLDGNTYREEEIAWRLLVSNLPPDCSVEKYDPKLKNCKLDNLKLESANGDEVFPWRVPENGARYVSPPPVEPKLSFL